MMSVLSHSTRFVNLGSICVTGLVLGGYEKESHEAHLCPTCRFSTPNDGLGTADAGHDAVIVMHILKVCMPQLHIHLKTSLPPGTGSSCTVVVCRHRDPLCLG
jgi:hypothetical protein